MLCVPMKGKENKVIGVIQMINKQGVIQTFDENDEQILTLLLSAASPIVEQFQHSYKDKGHLTPKKDDKFVSDLTTQDLRSTSMEQPMPLLEEEESEQDAFDEAEKKEDK